MRYALFGMLLACSAGPKESNTGLTTGTSSSGTTPTSTTDPSTTTGSSTGTGTDADTMLCDANTLADLAALTKGVSRLQANGSYASTLLTHTANAFPVVLDNDGHPFIAAARVGSGRVMHVGHERYVSAALFDASDGGQLIENAVAWMTTTDDPRIGVAGELTEMADFLANLGYRVATLEEARLDNLDIVVRPTYEDLPDEEDLALQTFVADGGGLLTAGHAWYWAYDNENPADNHPGNQMLRGSGLTITGMYANTDEDPTVDGTGSPLTHHGCALEAIVSHVAEETSLSFEELVQASNTVRHAIQHLPLSRAHYYDTADTFLETLEPVIPSPETPLISAEQPLESLYTTISWRYAEELPPEELTAHPASETFPGAVTGEVVTHRVTLSATYAGRDTRYAYSGAGADVWRSTGVYASPGQLLKVVVPSEAQDAGLEVLIGTHTDTLWHLEQIERFPDVTRRYPITSEETAVASAFGGLIYVTVPGGVSLGDIEVEIEGGVLAPRYIHGVTSATDWTEVERLRTAPWGELETQRLVITLPTSVLQTIEDPEALMDFWDRVQDANATLEGSDPLGRVRPERYTLDDQISAGWMHSGYPLMGYLVAAPDLMDLSMLSSRGSWGPFHELGHNHQWAPWILPGTTEASCNLFSAYVMETVVGVSWAEGHPALDPSNRSERIDAYLAGGADFWSDWTVWTALETHLQLQEAFGWEFYSTLFTNYRAIPDAELPTSDSARIDRWVLETSRVVEQDLTPFYDAWGFPIGSVTRAQVAKWPAWDRHPMASRTSD